jgi:hypothetical protein
MNTTNAIDPPTRTPAPPHITSPPPEILTEREAKARHLHSMTTEYHLPSEQALLDRVTADLRAGGIEYALVETGLGIEIWRSPGKSITRLKNGKLQY